MRWIDISPPLNERTAPWPGDVPFERTRVMGFDLGDHLELSSIRTTVHIGAHTDAPIHYRRGGEGIGERPLTRYLGPCEVRTVRAGPERRVDVAAWGPPPRAKRILLRTSSFPDPEVFTTDFHSFSPALVHHLADQGVILIGLDTPSVDPFEDRALLAHTAVAERDLAVLEGVVLTGVHDGVYLLIAAPLRIDGADAAPVRAVLGADLPLPLLDALESHAPSAKP